MRRPSLLRGMRIRVTDVLQVPAAGASFEEILEDYPYLEREDLFASMSMPLVQLITRFCDQLELPGR